MTTSYGIVRLIQAFPKIKIAAGETWEEPGRSVNTLAFFYRVWMPAELCQIDD